MQAVALRGYDGVSDANCWLDVQLPYMSKAEAEAQVATQLLQLQLQRIQLLERDLPM